MVDREDLGRDGFLPLTRPFQFLLRSLRAASVPYRLCPTSSWSAVMGSTEPQGLLHRGKSRVGDGDAGGVARSASLLLMRFELGFSVLSISKKKSFVLVPYPSENVPPYPARTSHLLDNTLFSRIKT